jgi:hypothetical protein
MHQWLDSRKTCQKAIESQDDGATPEFRENIQAVAAWNGKEKKSFHVLPQTPFRTTPMKQIAGSVSPKTPPFPEKGWELATMKQCNMFLFNELRKRTWGFVLNKPLPCRFSSKKML